MLCFQHFADYTVFERTGEKEKNKFLKKWVRVSVVVELECGNM